VRRVQPAARAGAINEARLTRSRSA
jgi:hypothetical protein